MFAGSVAALTLKSTISFHASAGESIISFAGVFGFMFIPAREKGNPVLIIFLNNFTNLPWVTFN
jgi:hypothetical protein